MKIGFICTCLMVAFSGSFTGYAQDYLLTSKGDSLVGEIKPLLFGTEKKVQIAEAGKKKTVFSFFQVKEYRFKGDVFRPVKGPYGYTFMKLQQEGYLSLYYFQAQNQVTFDGLFLLKRDGDGIEVPNLGFKKVMRRYLDDCPVVADKIDNDVYNKKDLNAIIQEYNGCIGTRSPKTETVAAAKKEEVKAEVKPNKVWDVLEEKVKAETDFEGKQNALDMIAEIKSKISAGQKIPNFLISGLQNSLPQETFKSELEAALKEINPQ